MFSQEDLDSMKNMHPVYYRVFLNRDDLICVVCMQDFDEYDYDQKRFFCDDSGEKV